MALLPKVKLKALVSFPANVTDGVGIDVVKENGNYQFDIAFDDFAPPVSGLTDPTNQTVLVWNSLTDSYVLAPVSLFGVGVGTGDVVGPASAVNNNIAVYDGTTGKLIKDGGVAIADIGGGTPSDANPIMDSVAAPGVGTDYSRFDHVHPSDTTKANTSHNHVAADVTDFSEAVDDRVNGLLVAGTNITLTYNDVANSMTIAASGSGGVPTTITVANEATDPTCFVGFFTAATGDLGPKTNTGMTFNSSTGVVTLASSILTTTDINGGTIDGAVIGASSAAAGTFALVTANGFVPNSSTVPSNGMYLPAANTLGWSISSAAEMQLTGTALSPAVDGGNSLGTTALAWQNLFLNTLATINIEAGNWVATHTTGVLTVGTGDLRVTTAGADTASVVTVGGSQTLTGKTLTSPTIGGTPTASGATWTNLGTVTTIDINGGTADGVVIGGSSAAAGTFTTAVANSFVPNLSTVPTNGMYLPAANTLGWAINSAIEMQLTGTALSPGADGGSSLGTTALGWQNLFGNTGFVLNIEAGDWVATHTAGILTVGTGDLRITNNFTAATSVVTVGGAQTLTNKTLTSPTMTAPALGTVASGNIAACTGLDSIVVANEAADTSCFVGFFTAATGELQPSTNANLTYNSNTGALSIGTTAPLTAGTIELGAATDTTIARSSAGNISVEGNVVYRASGTDVPLADGGTGASLADPNIDLVMGWDDSAGAVKFMALADINTEAAPVSGDFLLMYDAAGNLLKTDWNNLPGAAGGIPTEPSSTDNAVVRWDGGGGNAVQNSVLTIDDNGAALLSKSVAGPASVGLFIENPDVTSGTYLGMQSGTGSAFYFSASHATGLSYLEQTVGSVQFQTDDPAGFIIFTTDTLVDNWCLLLTGDGDLGIGKGAFTPDRKLHAEVDSASTAVPVPIFRLTATSTGTALAGFGPQGEFEAENGSGTNRVIGTIGAFYTVPTNAAEYGDVVVGVMRNGAAASEALRVSTDWPYFTDSLGNKSYAPKNVYLTSQHSVSSATATEVTGLQATLIAGTYRYDYRLIVQSSTAADGLKFGINYTGTATKIISMLTWPDTGTTATLGAIDDSANGTIGQIVAHSVSRAETTTGADMNTGTAGVATQAVNLMVQITGIIVVTDGGDLELWHASESTNATTVEVGSCLQVTRVN